MAAGNLELWSADYPPLALLELFHSVDHWLEDGFGKNESTPKNDYAINDDVKDPEETNTPNSSLKLSPDHDRRRRNHKPHSTPLTLKWLSENYEPAQGVCIPRSTLYVHYLDFCSRMGSHPINAASFGKIIRQQFPQLTTRRLGTRGQSKYHYYGIGVRETSVYYDVMYSTKGVDKNTEYRKESSRQAITYSPKSKLGTLLPEFPLVADITLPALVSPEKVETFLLMYRAHCQRILDTIIRANFDEVENFLVHFWQGIPEHLVTILDCDTIANLVGVCDAILYRVIVSVLMPAVMQPLPDSLTHVIRKFAKRLDEWLKVALTGLPTMLCEVKCDLARRFGQVLRRQTSLNHLCVAAASVLYNPEITGQMLRDWGKIDLGSIIKQTLYTMDSYSERDHRVIVKLCGEFEKLLESQSPTENFIDWLESLVERCVIQSMGYLAYTLRLLPKTMGEVSRMTGSSIRRVSRQFLLVWSCFGTRVIRDLTLYSAPSFGSFHLLHLMFDDYLMYLVERVTSHDRTDELMRSLKGDAQPYGTEEIVLPNPNKFQFPSTAPSCMHGEGAVARNTPSLSASFVSTDAEDDRLKPEICSTAPASVVTTEFSPIDMFAESQDFCYNQLVEAPNTCSGNQSVFSRHDCCQAISPPLTSEQGSFAYYPNTTSCSYENARRPACRAEMGGNARHDAFPGVGSAWSSNNSDQLTSSTPSESCLTSQDLIYRSDFPFTAAQYRQCEKQTICEPFKCMETSEIVGTRRSSTDCFENNSVADIQVSEINGNKRKCNNLSIDDYNQNTKCAKYNRDFTFHDNIPNGFVC